MIAARRLITALLAAMPQAAHAATLSAGAGFSVSPWRVIASLLLCLALGAVAILVLRKHYGLGQATLGRGADDRRIRVIEQQSLGPHRSLSLIEIDRQTYVALTAPGAATLVALERPPTNPTITSGDEVQA